MGVVTKNSGKEIRSGLYFAEVFSPRNPKQQQASDYIESIRNCLPVHVRPLVAAFGEDVWDVVVYGGPLLGVGFELFFESANYCGGKTPAIAANCIADVFPGTAVFFWDEGLSEHPLSCLLMVALPMENREELPIVAADSVKIVQSFLPTWPMQEQKAGAA